MEPASIADLLVSMNPMPPGWEQAFRDVDRAHFAPDRVWPFTYDGQQPAVDRALDPAAWGKAVGVMPWGGHYAPSHDLLLTLTVTDDHTATGRFEDGLSYMKARGQRTTWPQIPDHWWENDEATHGTSPTPAAWIEGALTGFGAPVIGFLLPNTLKTVEDEPAPGRTLYLHRQGPTGLSCALIGFGDDTDTTTVALGPDDLAGEFLGALRWWRHTACRKPKASASRSPRTANKPANTCGSANPTDHTGRTSEATPTAPSNVRSGRSGCPLRLQPPADPGNARPWHPPWCGRPRCPCTACWDSAAGQLVNPSGRYRSPGLPWTHE